MTLGTKLRILRTASNNSLEVVAMMLQISKTAIAKWEADKAKPSIDNLLKICNYYEIGIYKLLENVDNITFCNIPIKENSSTGIQNLIANDISSPESIENIVNNQKTITALVQLQNDLIVKLLGKG